MRILQVCPYAWDAPGGVQVHVRQLSARLRDLDHDVAVLTPARRPASEPGVWVVGRSIAVPYNGSVAPIAPDPRSMGVVKQAMERFRPDVVHVHEPFAPSTSMFATLRSDAPVVATFHAYVDRSVLLSIAAPALRAVWNRITAKVAVSNAAASFIRSRFGATPEIVPNGADVQLFAEAKPADLPPGRWVLFVSRLEPRKGFMVALRAFEILQERVTDVRFVAAGDGPERTAVEQLPPAVRDKVLMLGSVPNDQLPRYHAAADVFVAPATGRESFGYILVEAMAAGLPVVASRIPGYDEVVRDGVDGLLVPASNPPALATGLERVLSDPDMARRFGESGRARAGEFSWDRIAARLEPIYRRVA